MILVQVKDANVDTLMMKHFLSGFSDDDAKIILKHISDIQTTGNHILLFQVFHPTCFFRKYSFRPLLSGTIFAILLGRQKGFGFRLE